MKRASALVAITLIIVGCSASPLEKAKERYAFLNKQSVASGEMCTAARAVAEAATEAGDADEYSSAKIYVTSHCTFGAGSAEYQKIVNGVTADDLSSNTSASSSTPTTVDAATDGAAKAEQTAEVDLCWRDYCPCDGGGNVDVDRMLCRNLKGGVPVSASSMASGAALSDAKRSLDRWEARNRPAPPPEPIEPDAVLTQAQWSAGLGTDRQRQAYADRVDAEAAAAMAKYPITGNGAAARTPANVERDAMKN